jgi:hypothetical protein
MRRLLLIAVCVAACGAPRPPPPPPPAAAATPPPPKVPSAPRPPPGTAHATVRFDRDKLFLGENVLAHFCIENTSSEAFSIDVGGDYRGSSRSLRFKTTVTDDKGAVMADPDPNPFNLGGISHSPKLAPADVWCESLPLGRYARIDAPGTYTVKIVHDLGWKEDIAPTAEGRVTLAMPSAREAEQVVATMESLPSDPNRSAGKVSIPYRDFTALRYPVYLEPLVRRARAGSIEAVAGIGVIPNVDATRALVELLGHTDKKVARLAARVLSMRLPDPALSGALGARNVFANEVPEQRRYLISVGWRADLADDVRNAGLTLLAATDSDDLASGAFILEALGRASEAPALITALTRAIESSKTAPREDGIWPSPRGACQELLRAAEMLVARGAAPAATPKTPGDLAFWLAALGRGAKPKGWEAELGKALRHVIPYLRRLALEKMPVPVPAARVTDVGANLAFADVDVQTAACILVSRANLGALAEKSAAILATAKDRFLVDVCWTSASTLGARGAAVDALIGRLGDPDLGQNALGRLLDVFKHSGYSGGGTFDAAQGRALVPRWRAFVASHRKAIDAGEAISLDDPTVPHDLVPPGFKVTRNNGKPDWP